ncbi:hypothetical protein K438DRAFT_1800226, partial [Mycena galopus ATCC 62051]
MSTSEEKDLSTGSKEVEKANKASGPKISKSLAPHSTHTFKALLSSSLIKSTPDSIWSMFETNMRTMYTGSFFVWDLSKKQEELFNRLSHSLVAFTAFRFEFEDEDDDSNILYCYGTQISETSQRHGPGRTLMNHLAKIGADFKMDKIMLTVFEGDKGALKLYKDFGYDNLH